MQFELSATGSSCKLVEFNIIYEIQLQYFSSYFLFYDS